MDDEMIPVIDMPLPPPAPAQMAAMQVVASVTLPKFVDVRQLASQLRVGDVVFIRSDFLPFRKVADTTLSWTNHVGVVVDISGAEPLIAESRVPISGRTTFRRFVQRSAGGRVAVARLQDHPQGVAPEYLQRAARKRYGVLYDTGFNLYSRRQFCSRFVREVMFEATGITLGQVENFTTLLAHNPEADQRFWRVWYFGSIPWLRETVTPASLLRDDKLHVYFDGYSN
jgi:Permuted papain-like amidase enzyme, YaeF/YiiX, C92 family